MTQTIDSTGSVPRKISNHLARIVFAVFLTTFMLSRVMVILIMSKRVPDLFLHVGQTHVHHLNYGIFLLSSVGAWLLFKRPEGDKLDIAAVIYAIGLALTFDEFGMWIHLGGSYWQRASYDAVVTVGAILGLIAYAPAWRHLTWKHRLTALGLLLLVIAFGLLLADSVNRYGSHHNWRSMAELEQSGPQ